jgi:hypothetical protein
MFTTILSCLKVCVEVLDAIRTLLAYVSEMNVEFLREVKYSSRAQGNDTNSLATLVQTTSSHYAVVESKHPYEPATVQLYK